MLHVGSEAEWDDIASCEYWGLIGDTLIKVRSQRDLVTTNGPHQEAAQS